jgi:hypothetical protein
MISSKERGSGQARVTPVAVLQVLPSPGPSPSNDPVVIRAEMARTRAEMSVTINALRERFDPQRLEEEAATKVHDTATHLKKQAIERVREATIGKVEEKAREIRNNVKDTVFEARYGIADTIRHNPIPAALIGIGLAAMFFKGSERLGKPARWPLRNRRSRD